MNRIKQLWKSAVAWGAATLVPRSVMRWEWFLMRLFFAPLVWLDLDSPKVYQYTTQPEPKGIASLGIDLTWLSNDWVYPGILWVVGALLVPYVIGRGLLIVLPLLTLISVMVRTLENSQGAIQHSHQIIALVLLAQTAVAFWLLARRRRGLDPLPLPSRSYYLFYTQGIVAAAYVTAAVSKFFNSKGLWIWNSPYLTFDLVKSKRQAYYKKLDETLTGAPEVALWVIDHPMISRVAFGGAFFLELLAFVALAGRRWSLAVGLGVISLHQGIFFLMNLTFRNNELVALIFFVNVPFWLALPFLKNRGALLRS